MSKESPKITTVKKTEEVKDPKRAEAGKSSCSIMKRGKTEKSWRKVGKRKSMDGSNINYGYIIVGARVIVFAALYHAYKMNKEKKVKAEKIEETSAKTVKIEKNKKSKLDRFS